MKHNSAPSEGSGSECDRAIPRIMLNIAVPGVSVCGSEERSTFNKNLVRILKTEYNRVQSAAAAGKRYVEKTIRGGPDKSLALPARKQATATKLRIYSTYSPRSSIHFLARCSNFCKHLKKNSEGFPSNQVSATAISNALDEKWRTFNCFFFQSGEQVTVRRGQIWRIGW